MTGKSIRLERIIDRNDRRTIIVPMDHGVTVGPIDGLINMGKTVDMVAEGGANAVLGHVGLALHGHRGKGRDIGLILHLSASTMVSPHPDYKVLVNSVRRAIRMGADAISVHVNIGAEDEPQMLRDLGIVSEECDNWGMPLVAMMYPRGPKIRSEHDLDVVKLAARVGAELGADIVKTNYTGDPESFAKVVEGCPTPVVIAGGMKGDDKQVLQIIEGAMQAGAAGLSIGRNAFQHANPVAFIRAAAMIVHEKRSAEEAWEYLRAAS